MESHAPYSIISHSPKRFERRYVTTQLVGHHLLLFTKNPRIWATIGWIAVLPNALGFQDLAAMEIGGRIIKSKIMEIYCRINH